ncbi:hypothetical protein FEM03_21680 [Phragmitibacter flavus]|uniref:Uncharacterized protein n=1 Tax=Phragmitibacter flavus TaxID=2576071 RepID=A0A5R8K8L8_9BACT|nr:hypothetical protein [Phragmitibacter flavus]TLD68653.1 hypothetical protein FEM03_21680 [Phragmitibacter flavus]
MPQAQQRYLFEVFTPDELRQHCAPLTIFRYVRAIGGHANDTDELLAVFPYQDPDELLQKLQLLQIPVIHHPTSKPPPQPQPGVSYRIDEYQKTFPSLIPNTQWIEQPKWTTLHGEKVFIWCGPNTLRITLNEQPFVTPSDFTKATRLEAHLSPFAQALPHLDPPIDHWRCICPQHHPDLF